MTPEEPGVSVNDPCVSISTGTLSPDQRVNYAFGMILGLDEFLQEQQYFLEKGRLHERALHGFGTVYGLHVSTARSHDVPADYTITVAPGMAIDQWGREVVVRSAQCARLGAWLGAQEQARPGTIAANMGVSGEFTVYVVASYAQCADDLVPLPGQPCSSSQTMTASRWRDAWNIDLRWKPPPMPAWDTDRRLARLLSSVQIVAGLDPALSSESEIICAILALPSDVSAGPDDLWPLVDWPPGSPPSSPSGPVRYRLPAETAADALDRIFTLWVTQVRQLLSPGLTQPAVDSDPAVLLASINFTLGPVTSPPGPDPAIAWCDVPDDHGRPYVLHTRLLQELRILAEWGTANPQELATLTNDVGGEGQLILTAWFHLDRPVALTEPIQVRSRSGTSGSFQPAAPPGPDGTVPEFSDVWILTPASDFPAIDRDQVAVSFAPESVRVGDPATTLADRVAQGLDLLDTTAAGDVVVFGTVQVPVTLPPPPPPPPPPLEFVTITPVTAKVPAEELMFELWFHVQPEWRVPQVVITELIPDVIALVEERTEQFSRAIAVEQQPPPISNVWRAAFGLKGLNVAGYLRFVFLATRIFVTVNGVERLPLADWMEKSGFRFLNWDPFHKTLTAYLRLAGPQ